MGYCVVLITVPDAESGKRIAETLVEERLAACANRLPGLLSTYRWQGKVEQAAEELLVVKTREELVEGLTARVRELHPYTVPEIIALPIVAGSQYYLNWIALETRG